MMLNKSTDYQEKPDDNSIESKIFTTRNVIKNKFEKVRMSRIELEAEAARTMKLNNIHPNVITSDSALSCDSQPKEISFAHPKQNMQLNEETNCIINALCKRLRLLISSPLSNTVNRTQEMNSILDKLRALDILV